MKKKQGFNLRTICGEHVIVAEGRENIDFSKIISLNDTAAFLWNAAPADHFTADDLVEKLTAEYDVDPATALADIKSMLQQWLEAGIVEA